MLIPFYVRGRVLEVGCGNGAMLRLLRSLGWNDLYGIEVDVEAADSARATGATILTARIEDGLREFPDEHFSVVVASMVMEHVDRPYEVIGEIARKIEPNGQLLLSTIDRDSLDAKIFGEFWTGFDFPRHMTYFRRSDISALLERDFDRLEWFHQDVPNDWISSASWRSDPLDRAILSASPLVRLASTAIALAGRATRVSIRARRKA